jgi:hypothetical protein
MGEDGPGEIGPAGAFEQEYTVLRNSLFNNALSDDTGTVKITYRYCWSTLLIVLDDL